GAARLGADRLRGHPQALARHRPAAARPGTHRSAARAGHLRHRTAAGGARAPRRRARDHAAGPLPRGRRARARPRVPARPRHRDGPVPRRRALLLPAEGLRVPRRRPARGRLRDRHHPGAARPRRAGRAGRARGRGRARRCARRAGRRPRPPGPPGRGRPRQRRAGARLADPLPRDAGPPRARPPQRGAGMTALGNSRTGRTEHRRPAPPAEASHEPAPRLAARGEDPSRSGARSRLRRLWGTSAVPRKERLDPSALRRTLRVIRPHLPRHLLLCLVGMIGLLADVAFRVLEPWPLKFAVDAVTAALGADLPSDAAPFGLNIEQTVIAAAICLALIIGGRAASNYLATISFPKVGARIATAPRTRACDHLQALSLRYHSRASIGDTSQRLVGDVGRLQDVAVTAGLPLVGNVLTLTVLLVVMVLLDPLLSAVVIASGLAYLLL